MPELTQTLLVDASLFKGVDSALSAELAARGNIIKVSEGQSLFIEGDEPEGFYIVRSGGLKATRLSADGDEQLLAIFSTGDAIGEMGMFDDAPRSASITALKESVLMHWPRAGFFRFADEQPALYRHLLGVMSRRLRDTNDALAARDFLPLAGQLAQVMLRLAKGFGEHRADGSTRIGHRLTQAELAAMIGASRENVSRVINTWKRKGILTREEGCYVLLDKDALQDLSEG